MSDAHTQREQPPQPRLDIRAPLVAGTAATILFFGAGLGATAFVPVEHGVSFEGRIAAGTQTTPVRLPGGGTLARVLIAPGQKVQAGDVMMSLDTRVLGEEIAAMTAQLEAAQKQLELAKLEAATMTDLAERKLVVETKIAALRDEAAVIGREVATLNARIEQAGAELERRNIRAPVSGRIAVLKLTGAGERIEPGATVLEIMPEEGLLVVDGTVDAREAAGLKPGLPAKVWLTSSRWRNARPFDGKLAWLSAGAAGGNGAAPVALRIELSDARAARASASGLDAGQPAGILLVTAERTLLSQLTAPITRSFNRIFGSRA
jgi:RND family efflux transporter MFP subunit